MFYYSFGNEMNLNVFDDLILIYIIMMFHISLSF